MSFWVGVVAIVLVLEAVRIGLSSYLLLHILHGIERSDREEVAEARPTAWRQERDRLASDAMLALRRSMDELAEPGESPSSRPAVDALNAYILHLQEPGRQ